MRELFGLVYVKPDEATEANMISVKNEGAGSIMIQRDPRARDKKSELM